MSIANLIREWRRSEGWTLSDLSTRCGLAVSYLSDIERGRTEPSVKALRSLAGAFGANLEVRFIRGKEAQP
jgi:transcriptional regulator with XRE-family HTH domain